MASLTLRLVKGSPLTNSEVDNNFSNLNNETVGNTSNIGILANLLTTAKSNLVAAINEIETVGVDKITNGTSNVVIASSGGNIVSYVNSRLAFTISNTNSNANIVVNGNVITNVTRTTLLQDRRGNVLVIKDETGATIWGG